MPQKPQLVLSNPGEGGGGGGRQGHTCMSHRPRKCPCSLLFKIQNKQFFIWILTKNFRFSLITHPDDNATELHPGCDRRQREQSFERLQVVSPGDGHTCHCPSLAWPPTPRA